MGWNDMPVVHMRLYHCQKCGGMRTHRCVEYKDESIRTCTRCKTRTSVEFEGSKETGRETKTPPKKLPPLKKMGRPKKGEKREDE